jgi:PKD repeat protein
MSGWFVDSLAINGRSCCGTNFVVPPLIEPTSAALLSEACAPTNAAPDPGEVVNYNFVLRNIGLSNATNVMATLLATNGVSSPSAPKNYGALNAGAPGVTNSFSFTASGTCGETIMPTFLLQDGAQNLGTVVFALPLGRFTTNFSESFDGVSAPALPASWTTSGSGSQSPWSTTAGSADSAPNSIFSADASSVGINQLITPPIIVPATALQLSFRHSYDLEASSGASAYDGGVLEIKIGAGPFTDIITAGGTFLEGAYSHTISSSYSNALAGSRCWSGSSSGFMTSTVLLPSAASGQTIQFRWRCSTDSSVGAPGWSLDSVLLLARVCCGEITAPVANFSATPTLGGKPLTVTFTDTSSGTISNRFWNFGNGGTTNTSLSSVAFTYNNGGTNSVTLTVIGPLGTNTLTRTNYIVVTNALPLLVSNSFALVAETCTNTAIDPGETVTMNFGLKNIGAAPTSNLVATLLTSGGITSPSAPQNYGTLATNTSTAKAFTFIPTGTCGTTNTATLQLQDGSLNLGTVSFRLVLGQPGGLAFSQNFDTVTAPALPAGWTTATASSGIAWVTSTTQSDSGVNSIFSPSIDGIGLAELVTPVILLPNGASQLSFHHRYDMEAGFDGGVLELKIGNGAFASITNGGGAFVANGYDSIISSTTGNPLAGQYAWSGASSGFVTTTINLPPAAWGQNVQLRWRIGSDESFANMGWYVDTILISGFQCCANPPYIITQPQSQIVPLGTNASFNVTAGGTAPLSYQWRFNGTNLYGATTSSLSRSNVQSADLGPYLVVITNSLGSVTSSVASLSVANNRPTLLWPHLSNGNFGFVISGNAGDNYVVEGSTNLSNWASIITLSNATGQVPFTESNVWVYPGRAYRARLIP